MNYSLYSFDDYSSICVLGNPSLEPNLYCLSDFLKMRHRYLRQRRMLEKTLDPKVGDKKKSLLEV